ncbi:F-box domain protein, partial [Ancylostoma caninum]
ADQVAEFSEPQKTSDYFPFFSLPKELRLRILKELDRWKLKALRQLSHSMYALCIPILYQNTRNYKYFAVLFWQVVPRILPR